MLKEFRAFIMRGNVFELAVAVIMGAAFGPIVSSLVNDIVMPPIGLLLGNTDFANLFIVLKGGTFDTLAAAQEAGAVTINYGIFINAVINFIVVAFVIFLLVRQVNRLKKKEEAAPAAPPAPSNEEVLLGEIRDLLKAKQ